jgi:hypothetical protein
MNTSSPKLPRENVYTCQTCGFMLLTVDVAHGTTPFMIECKAKTCCEGFMHSSMYPTGPKPARYPKEPSHEWYRPTPEEFHKLADYNREHVAKGGLLLRPRTDATPVCHGEESDEKEAHALAALIEKPLRPLPLRHIPGKFGRRKHY